ncbi:MAG: hypothetical protein PHQ18_01545 [Patescibacteria group bacterium]|nr:hypothetical protein [Patescibacteria group bacterium]
MNKKQKIYYILKEIKEESEINPEPHWVIYHFNTNFVAPNTLMADEEKRILQKLENEGIIEINLPIGRDEQEEAMLSIFTPIEFMMEHDLILIKILPKFYRKYFWYSISSLKENKWNYINPFWILWKLLTLIFIFIVWLWKKNKIITILIGFISSILVYDWSLAWQNLNKVIDFIKNIN